MSESDFKALLNSSTVQSAIRHGITWAMGMFGWKVVDDTLGPAAAVLTTLIAFFCALLWSRMNSAKNINTPAPPPTP